MLLFNAAGWVGAGVSGKGCSVGIVIHQCIPDTINDAPIPHEKHLFLRLTTLQAHPARLRVAAIRFLNPAPLLWDFEHPPEDAALRERYDVRYTLPSACAAQLASGEADLGLVPIGAMPGMPGVVAVPGCTIASLHRVRSIQLVLRPGITPGTIRTLAADAASRSSVAYVRILLEHFYGNRPDVMQQPANLPAMLSGADAALLIGDPALMALEERDREGAFEDCTWIDVAELWHQKTGFPWVAAVWAVRPEALGPAGTSAERLTNDLNRSREHGAEHVEDLVQEWTDRLRLSPETIRHYLTVNIHYQLNDDCLASIERFYELGSGIGLFPGYRLPLLR